MSYTPYPKSGCSSAITGYKIEPDRIYIRFEGGRIYGYSYKSAGVNHIEEMKRLAEEGEGLCRYIRSNVSRGFFYKSSEGNPLPVVKERVITDKGIIRMLPALREFDFRPYLEINSSQHGFRPDRIRPYFEYGRIRVYYADTIAEQDKVPGLIDVVRAEYEVIIENIMRYAGCDSFPEELSIELSDHYVQSRYGTMSDSDIVDAIKNLYDANPSPNPQWVREILSNRFHQDDTVGMYRSEPRVIQLYYRMFDVNNGEIAYLAQLRNTLAHELLHAVHHIWSPETFCDDSREAMRVKEALADYYAFQYSMDPEYCRWDFSVFRESLRTCEKRFYAWLRSFGGSWPYAYAIAFIPEDTEIRRQFSNRRADYNICSEKYRKVFHISRRNMQEAYRCLMKNR